MLRCGWELGSTSIFMQSAMFVIFQAVWLHSHLTEIVVLARLRSTNWAIPAFKQMI